MTQKPIKVILNPYSNHGNARKKIEVVKAAFNRLAMAFELAIIQSPGEGVELSRQAVNAGYKIVVAAGGDSTVSEVVNGLVQASGDDVAGTLGIIPLGTANDLSDVLALPRKIDESCKRIQQGKTRIIDICQVNDAYFGNNSAVGLEAMVSQRATKIRQVKGAYRYLLAAFLTVWSEPGWLAHITWDTGSFRGPITLVSIGNSPRTGGYFWMTPDAKLDDGQLDFVFSYALGRYRLLRLLPMVLRGKHINYSSVVHLRSTSLSITIEPAPLQVDGEVVDLEATHLEYKVLPQKLRVIV